MKGLKDFIFILLIPLVGFLMYDDIKMVLLFMAVISPLTIALYYLMKVKNIYPRITLAMG